jgi:D-sedoheptulose 7-phosphate isomerase
MKATRKEAASGPLERQARQALHTAGASLARLERACARPVAGAAEAMIACLASGGTIYFCGNGGSAADAQHIAAELSGRYRLERPALAAIALSTNSSALTAIGNDYGYEFVFSRQLEGLGAPGDVLVAITTSGGSKSVIRAVEVAHQCGMTVIGMTGSKGGRFAALCDLALVTPSDSTPRIQEGHITMGHIVCEMVEVALFGGAAGSPGALRGLPVAKSGADGARRPRAARPRSRTTRRAR